MAGPKTTEPTPPDGLAGVVADAVAHPERMLKVADLYTAAIGPRQQAYYLKQFSYQEAGPGLRLSWHWPAFFSALNWLVFRKMWAWAGRYAALWTLGVVATVWVSDVWRLERWEGFVLGAAAWTVLSVLAGVLANALYYRHCMALIHGVLVNGADRDAAVAVLGEHACGDRRLTGQLLANVALLFLWSALAIFAPWSGHGAWLFSGSETRVAGPEPSVPDTERRVLSPGTETPTLKITSAPTAPAALLPTTPVSEARVSALAGLVLPGDPVPEPKLVPEPVGALTPAARTAAFGVQVGIFGQPANVANVLTQLKAQGLPVYTDAVTLGGQPRTRVRVGPYVTRDEAQRVAGQIAEVGLPAVLVPLPATATQTSR